MRAIVPWPVRSTLRMRGRQERNDPFNARGATVRCQRSFNMPGKPSITTVKKSLVLESRIARRFRSMLRKIIPAVAAEENPPLVRATSRQTDAASLQRFPGPRHIYAKRRGSFPRNDFCLVFSRVWAGHGRSRRRCSCWRWSTRPGAEARLREAHLIAIKEIERLNLRIGELESRSRRTKAMKRSRVITVF